MDSSGKGDRKEYGEVFLRKIGHKVGEILPMPRTAVKILQLLDDPEVDIKDLEKVVISDQAIVAQVLKIANSALYGYAQTISTVSRALMVMGLITFKNLTLSVSLKSLYKTKGKPDFITTKLWEHSIGVALCSKMLANKMKENIEEEVMICGLIHDIGKLVLLKYLPDVYTEIIQEVYNNGYSCIDLETEYLGFNHTHVGYMLVEKWKLSELLSKATCYHHDDKWILAHENMHLGIIYLANLICLKFGIGIAVNDNINLLATPLAVQWNLSEAFLDTLIIQFLDVFEAQKMLLF